MGLINNAYPIGLSFGSASGRYGNKQSYPLKSNISIQFATAPNSDDSSSFPAGHRVVNSAFYPIKDGGLAAILSGVSAQAVSITGIGNLIANLNGIGSQVVLVNDGRYITASLSGAGVQIVALDGYGNLICEINIGAQPSAFDIAQAVWSLSNTAFNTPDTFGKSAKSTEKNAGLVPGLF